MILWTVAHQDPLSAGFSRQEYWGGLLFLPPGALPSPGMESASSVSPASQADSLPAEPLGMPPCAPLLYLSVAKLLSILAALRGPHQGLHTLTSRISTATGRKCRRSRRIDNLLLRLGNLLLRLDNYLSTGLKSTFAVPFFFFVVPLLMSLAFFFLLLFHLCHLTHLSRSHKRLFILMLLEVLLLENTEIH